MFGTDNGIWFAIKTQPDGTVDYEFYQFENKVDHGVAQSEGEMLMRFDALCDAAARPYC